MGGVPNLDLVRCLSQAHGTEHSTPEKGYYHSKSSSMSLFCLLTTSKRCVLFSLSSVGGGESDMYHT